MAAAPQPDGCDEARCVECGRPIQGGYALRDFDGLRCIDCLERLADALLDEARMAAYDRAHPFGQGM
jgi:hypothetical protein